MSRERHPQPHEPDQRPSSGPPGVRELLRRLRELYGPETVLDGGAAARWWVDGSRPDTGVALWLGLTPPREGEPCVVWVTRPGEDKPERCPISTMGHLNAFLALVSIARRTPEPVHGNVCPGED